MKNTLRYLWAKKSRHGDPGWLPLDIHLRDCAAVASHIWQKWLPDGVMQCLARHCDCEPDEAKRLFIFTAAAHDIGKATPAFQAVSGFYNSRDLEERILENLALAGLPMKPYESFVAPRRTPHAIASQLIAERAGLSERVSVILGSHHGRTPTATELTDNMIECAPENYHLENTGKRPWTDAQGDILQYAMRISGVQDLSALPEPDAAAQLLLVGLLVMADWIASNEDFFPLIGIDEDLPDADERVARALERLGFLDTRWFPDNAWMDEAFFENRFSFSPNSIQQCVLDSLAACDSPRLLILEAPMGAGKTEAALAAAELMANVSGRSGLYFALPTQATSDGIFPRLLEWIARLENGAHSIELIHGKAQFNDTFTSLRRLDGRADTLWGNDAETSGAAIASWFTGRKKSMLADFAVGTIDQLLQLALVQKHLMLRHAGFAGKVVVIDECHAFDAYMNRYLERALTWLGAYGVPVVLLSATLPSAKRDDMINAYLNSTRTRRFISSTSGYPLLSYIDGETVAQKAIAPEGAGSSVAVSLITDGDVSALLRAFADGGGCVGIITNTVSRAQSMANDLKSEFGDAVMLIHSRLVATDRLARERTLRRELGKPSAGNERPVWRIVVGTQVLEQSLDVDFDVLISDFCPMDLLLQRLGRLHRHRRARPIALRDARCYIIGEEGYAFEAGASAIYGDYILMRTKALLPASIRMPEDISPLVQQTYGTDDGIFAALPDGYEQKKEEWASFAAIKKGKAGSFLLKKPDDYETLEGMLYSPFDSDGAAEASVRDIDKSIEVCIVRRSGGSLTLFSNADCELSPDLPDDDTAKLIARDCLRLPPFMLKYGAANSIVREIERLDAELFPRWQDSPWLKGSLILPLDQDGCACVCGYQLIYDSFLGLKYKREGD